MSVTLHGDRVRADLRQSVGRELLRIAIALQAAGQRKMSVSNAGGAAPSKPGEWLRRGQGHGIAGLAYEPTTPAAIGQAGQVRLGFTQNAFYMALWGAPGRAGRRKSLADLVEEVGPQLSAPQGGTP